jgi:hypothetical protein
MAFINSYLPDPSKIKYCFVNIRGRSYYDDSIIIFDDNHGIVYHAGSKVKILKNGIELPKPDEYINEFYVKAINDKGWCRVLVKNEISKPNIELIELNYVIRDFQKLAEVGYDIVILKDKN